MTESINKCAVKYMQFLYINYTSVKLLKKKKTEELP